MEIDIENTKSLLGSAGMHRKEPYTCAVTRKRWVKVTYFNLFTSTAIECIFLVANILSLLQKPKRMGTRAEKVLRCLLNCFKLPMAWKYSRICDMSCLTFFLFQTLKEINLHKEQLTFKNEKRLCDSVWNLTVLLYFPLLADHHDKTAESNTFFYV